MNNIKIEYRNNGRMFEHNRKCVILCGGTEIFAYEYQSNLKESIAGMGAAINKFFVENPEYNRKVWSTQKLY